MSQPWLLPQGIEEVLAKDANRLECLRRQLLDLYQSWGYDLVMPPFIEYIESLMGHLGEDLALQTFKVTDQASGRLMGIRADMTPQVARIDAQKLDQNIPSRLCYMGTVLRARADAFANTRSPLQVGCELYGHTGVASDFEIIRLMIATVMHVGITEFTVDLGHVGIFRGLTQQCGFAAAEEAAFFDCLQRKSIPEIEQWLQRQNLEPTQVDMLNALSYLNGDISVLAKARTVLSAANSEVHQAIDYIEQTVLLLQRYFPKLNLHLDLAELHGYHYKTGLTFAVFVPGVGQEIARGGRYDNIGAAFGHARAATGFSTDLKHLVCISDMDVSVKQAIWAPNQHTPELMAKIEALRAAGERVIDALDYDEECAKSLGCNRKLVKSEGHWILQAL